MLKKERNNLIERIKIYSWLGYNQVLITKIVKVKWHNTTKKWYESKGYIFTKYKEEFEVRVKDLPDGCSSVRVDIKCDECGEILNIKWEKYIRYAKKDGKYYCRKCAYKLFGVKKIKQTKLINSITFYDWCYNNLSKEEADQILSRWDYDLNKLSPKDISYGSMGINKKGHWFKCPDYPEHESEQKNVSSFTKGHEGSITCNKCNSIALTHPHLVRYFVNKQDSLKYSMGSNKKVSMKCPECGFEKEMEVNGLNWRGFCCPRCSDGKSYPEKFMFRFLEQLDVIFKSQLSKTTFKWCDKYKYDFYISNNIIICIIETHGIQHYEENENWNVSLTETQENDTLKEQLAKENSIENYIILDCRRSELEWIKNSIMSSRLSTLLNFKEDDIDWLKCHEWACNSLVKVVCDLWENSKNTLEIAKELKINKNTVRIYLKKGVEIGWCDYNASEESRNNYISISKNHERPVICLNTEEIFESLTKAGKQYNINKNNISSCVRNRTKSAGGHPETGDPLLWMYYDEYVIRNDTLGWRDEYIDSYNGSKRKVICLTTNKVFSSIIEASNTYNISYSDISRCCRNKIKFTGKQINTDEPLEWMYYKEYINNKTLGDK